MGKSASKESQTNREKLEETVRSDPMDIIQKNYILLIEHLDSEQAVDRLFQNFTLTPGENEELFHAVGAQRKSKMLVTKLRTKSRKQITDFVEIIKDIQPYLYDIMLSNSLHAIGPHFGWMDTNEQECEPCKVRENKFPATDWCYQCCEAMCQRCATIHKSMKLLRHHSLKKLADMQTQAKECDSNIQSGNPNSKPSRDNLLTVTSGNNMPIHIKGDKEGSIGVTDITHVTINGISILLVVDWHNECVKSFAEIGSKVKCKRLQMAGCPFRMSKLSKNQIAVTMSTSSFITIIDVGIGVLHISNVIKTSKQYDGICCLGFDKFAVSGQALDIINSKGDVLETIGIANNLFSNPDYLTGTPTGDIIVSDIKNSRVVCITQKGQIQWIYQPQCEPKLEFPQGIHCDIKGNVYIVDWDMHSVSILSSEGKFKQILVAAKNRVYHPRAVCTDDARERLFVVQDGGFARIYKLSAI